MARVVLTGQVEKDGDQFTALCLELGVASCGETVDEALDNLGDALEVYLSDLEDMGEIKRVFDEKGVEVRPDDLTSGKVSISVPPDKTVRAYPKQVSSLAAT